MSLIDWMFLQSESFLLNKRACVRCNLQPIMSTYTYTASPLYANGLFIHCCIVTYIRIQCLYEYKTDKQTTNRNLCFVFTVRAFLKNKLISLVKFVELKTELKISNDYGHLRMWSLQTLCPQWMEFLNVKQ